MQQLLADRNNKIIDSLAIVEQPYIVFLVCLRQRFEQYKTSLNCTRDAHFLRFSNGLWQATQTLTESGKSVASL